jgi:hypothetical protein
MLQNTTYNDIYSDIYDKIDQDRRLMCISLINAILETKLMRMCGNDPSYTVNRMTVLICQPMQPQLQYDIHTFDAGINFVKHCDLISFNHNSVVTLEAINKCIHSIKTRDRSYVFTGLELREELRAIIINSNMYHEIELSRAVIEFINLTEFTYPSPATKRRYESFIIMKMCNLLPDDIISNINEWIGKRVNN